VDLLFVFRIRVHTGQGKVEKVREFEWSGNTIQYNTIQYKTYNAPYVTKMLFVGAGMTRD